MSAPTELTLTSKIQFLPGVGPSRVERFRKLGIRSIQDLLFFFPRDYEHPAAEVAVDKLRDGQVASITGIVTDVELTARTPGRSIFGAVVTNPTGAVRMVFFNQPFRADTILLDRRVMISGTASQKGLRMEFTHPKVRFLTSDEETGAGEILPVYSLTEGFKQVNLRRWTRDVLDQFKDQLAEVLPESVRREMASRIRAAKIDLGAVEPDGALPEIKLAIEQMHFPSDDRSLLAAQTRFVFQELLVMQLALAMRRRQLTTELNAPAMESSPIIDARIRNRFAFELTGDQRKVIQEISRDMSRQFPMNRMLQGDVGSGKTVVAIYAMLLAVANGYQAVLMAPTEVLARQHFATLQGIAKDSKVRAGLLCGSIIAKARRETLRDVANGDIDLLIGTQALLHGLGFHRLGLCVIDEQHKFGVGQRTTLRSGEMDPHYLVMSATPIPRSMGMTLFGDVELSTIREKPPGRSEVHTYLAKDDWKRRWWQFVKERLLEGRQAYVVAPRVNATTAELPDSEANKNKLPSDQECVGSSAEGEQPEVASTNEDVSSVESIFSELRDDVLPEFRIGLLHGRMTNDEKQAVMEEFQAGRLQVLVSTTVIEVGIDVPNATVMTIMGGNRFGLAQLHQLRGRISRGVHPGHVAVFSDGDLPPHENERLGVFESTNDGFELAEADFRLRGPGDLLGKRQSGLPPLRIADLNRDVELLTVAREMAQDMVDADPSLEASDLHDLQQQVLRRYGARLEIGDVA
ncbi:MAG: ATP-dependent DNA helicase RecG [Planctomycetota bacterium]